jgi:hypothetical protein
MATETKTTNEAAKRLHYEIPNPANTPEELRMWLDEALAAERRATVERLEAAIFADTIEANPYLRRDKVQRILREEAQR